MLEKGAFIVKGLCHPVDSILTTNRLQSEQSAEPLRAISYNYHVMMFLKVLWIVSLSVLLAMLLMVLPQWLTHLSLRGRLGSSRSWPTWAQTSGEVFGPVIVLVLGSIFQYCSVFGFDFAVSIAINMKPTILSNGGCTLGLCTCRTWS